MVESHGILKNGTDVISGPGIKSFFILNVAVV